MRRLKIQRVRSVPPIPTTIIVIPNVQLSMRYLLITFGEVSIQIRLTSHSNELEK
jgi:hypothetical protein